MRNEHRYLSATIGAALLLAGCASGPERSARPPSFNLSIVDDAEGQRFTLHLRSSDDRALCLDEEQWPTSLGQLHSGSDAAILHTGERAFKVADRNFGYCPGGCGSIEVPAHGVLEGYIPYAEFGNAEEIRQPKDRRLEFLITPHPCSRSEHRVRQK